MVRALWLEPLAGARKLKKIIRKGGGEGFFYKLLVHIFPQHKKISVNKKKKKIRT